MLGGVFTHRRRVLSRDWVCGSVYGRGFGVTPLVQAVVLQSNDVFVVFVRKDYQRTRVFFIVKKFVARWL
jgi:hypothetical protein